MRLQYSRSSVDGNVNQAKALELWYQASGQEDNSETQVTVTVVPPRLRQASIASITSSSIDQLLLLLKLEHQGRDDIYDGSYGRQY